MIEKNKADAEQQKVYAELRHSYDLREKSLLETMTAYAEQIKQMQETHENEMMELRLITADLRDRVHALESVLEKNGIPFPKTGKRVNDLPRRGPGTKPLQGFAQHE